MDIGTEEQLSGKFLEIKFLKHRENHRVRNSENYIQEFLFRDLIRPLEAIGLLNKRKMAEI